MQEQQTKTLKVEVRTAKNAWEQGTTDCVFTPFDRAQNKKNTCLLIGSPRIVILGRCLHQHEVIFHKKPLIYAENSIKGKSWKQSNRLLITNMGPDVIDRTV
ncbi:hypothetical protein OUZ56_001175 [Daphnia magna]|uniref:Uncharacterized protein n=1 Tax=Daphnia magna TaxID=35525 RepID=A0ABR0A1V3_9CRUS|nr:hypothetical protein OUZ56_001175 [Daphnia magna]